jgi:hypothetical protein
MMSAASSVIISWQSAALAMAPQAITMSLVGHYAAGLKHDHVGSGGAAQGVEGVAAQLAHVAAAASVVLLRVAAWGAVAAFLALAAHHSSI